MNKILILLSILLVIGLYHSPVLAEDSTGKELYMNLCSKCHPDGGNKIKPDKPLFRKSLEEQGIKTTDDIISVMRNRGKGMKKFTEEKLGSDDAKKIAEYVQDAFK